MKVLPGPNAPLPTAAAEAAHARRYAWIIGLGFALFAIGAFAAALIV
jgi:hypothetical protein